MVVYKSITIEHEYNIIDLPEQLRIPVQHFSQLVSERTNQRYEDFLRSSIRNVMDLLNNSENRGDMLQDIITFYGIEINFLINTRHDAINFN